jgi:Ca-activated chloride channel homolog
MKHKSRTRYLMLELFAMVAVIATALWSGCEMKQEPLGVSQLPGPGTAPSFSGGGYAGALWQQQSPAARSISAPVNAEELWVIVRSSDSAAAQAKDTPGSGTLMTKVEEKEVPMPLKHTDVRASVSGYIGSVEVVQQFQNPYSSKIEAVYVFPLPHNAAINEFVMTIGERKIRGIIRERKEAEEIYQQAKSQGYVASLLTEERPNVFTQSVANIEPGKEIDVTIRYFHTLEYVDGWYEFVFPMVVGPRFNPPGMTNGIGAAARSDAGASGQKTEVQYLKPGERSGHDISLQLDVDAGVAIEEFRCATHDVTHESASINQLTVTLKPEDSIPNRDFVLRYRVAGERIKSSLLTQRGQRGGYFTLMLYPPQELGNLTRQPLELVFVLDCSGSMSGRPIEQAKAAVQRALQLLRPGDSFQIVNFNIGASQLDTRPLEATPQNVQRGLNYVGNLRAEGGTMAVEGVKAALNFPHDPERLRFVCFLTDGYIGNEAEVLAEIHKRLGPSRIFSFGVGSAVNRYLLDHMARTGRGVVAYLGSRDDGATIMEDFIARIGHPGLTDIAIDWGGMQVSEVFPSAMPDLFVGRPVILTGRFQGDGNATIRVSGKMSGETVEVAVPADLNDATATHNGLPSIWARMKIADLAEQSIYTPNNDLPEQIKRVALDYGLMSAFTAFVAVDSTRQTEGAEGTTVPVAVPVPEGVNYHTTVPEKKQNTPPLR